MSPDQSAPAPLTSASREPTEPAVSSDGAPAASRSEPAQDRPSLGTLAEAFRSDPGALKDRTPQERATASPSDQEPSEDSAAGDAGRSPSASKSDESPAQPGQPSRRGAAAKISEQQSEIDRLVSEREAERARLADTEARVQAQDRAREQARQAALSRIGDDQEFATLANKRMRGEVLSYEDDEKLTSMLQWREHAADLWEMADRAHKTALASSVGDRAERYGLDRETAYSASLPDLLDHAVSVTEARVRKEQANQIAELKAELRGLRTRGAGAAAPTVGGSSAGSTDGLLPDGASPLDWFRVGAKRQQEAAQGAGRNGRR